MAAYFSCLEIARFVLMIAVGMLAFSASLAYCVEAEIGSGVLLIQLACNFREERVEKENW